MKVLVTGSTRWVDSSLVESVLDEYRAADADLVVLTGMALGADEVARQWAKQHGIRLRAEPLIDGDYPGPMHIYNERMLGWKPDVVLAFKSDLDLAGRPYAGTEHMCLIAAAAGVSVRFFS